MKNFISDLSKHEFPVSEKIAANSLNPQLFTFIKQRHPYLNESHFIAESELKSFRKKFILENLIRQTGEISETEKTVFESISEDTILADVIEDTDKMPPSFSERLADKVAEFGGSWTFILSFIVFLLLWIGVNMFILMNKGFDPYPFILLNLILSCIAALQAPVIMMSQNRQEEKDRERAKKDYMVNLKAEIEIKAINDKIDRLISLYHKLVEKQKD